MNISKHRANTLKLWGARLTDLSFFRTKIKYLDFAHILVLFKGFSRFKTQARMVFKSGDEFDSTNAKLNLG